MTYNYHCFVQLQRISFFFNISQYHFFSQISVTVFSIKKWLLEIDYMKTKNEVEKSRISRIITANRASEGRSG